MLDGRQFCVTIARPSKEACITLSTSYSYIHSSSHYMYENWNEHEIQNGVNRMDKGQ